MITIRSCSMGSTPNITQHGIWKKSSFFFASRDVLCRHIFHYSGVIMITMESQVTGVPIFCSTVCSGADHKTVQSSASLAFVRGIHRWPVYSAHKGPVTRKMFLFNDVIVVNVIKIIRNRYPLQEAVKLIRQYFAKATSIQNTNIDFAFDQIIEQVTS